MLVGNFSITWSWNENTILQIVWIIVTIVGLFLTLTQIKSNAKRKEEERIIDSISLFNSIKKESEFIYAIHENINIQLFEKDFLSPENNKLPENFLVSFFTKAIDEKIFNLFNFYCLYKKTKRECNVLEENECDFLKFKSLFEKKYDDILKNIKQEIILSYVENIANEKEKKFCLSLIDSCSNKWSNSQINLYNSILNHYYYCLSKVLETLEIIALRRNLHKHKYLDLIDRKIFHLILELYPVICLKINYEKEWIEEKKLKNIKHKKRASRFFYNEYKHAIKLFVNSKNCVFS